MSNIALGTSRARLNDLKSQRATILENAEKELTAGNLTEHKSLMAKAQELNPQIEDLDNLVKEYDRYDIAHTPKFGNDAKDMQEMGKMLLAGERNCAICYRDGKYEAVPFEQVVNGSKDIPEDQYRIFQILSGYK
mgnify:CR=1 FL=1